MKQIYVCRKHRKVLHRLRTQQVWRTASAYFWLSLINNKKANLTTRPCNKCVEQMEACNERKTS